MNQSSTSPLTRITIMSSSSKSNVNQIVQALLNTQKLLMKELEQRNKHIEFLQKQIALENQWKATYKSQVEMESQVIEELDDYFKE